MKFQPNQFTHVPTVNYHIFTFGDARSPFTQLAWKAEKDQCQLVLSALKAEPMISAEGAPSGVTVPIKGVIRHIRTLEKEGHQIHSKMLGWRDRYGRERRTTYYGLYQQLERKFFKWGYEKSFLQAFDDLEASCKLVGFDINPQKRELTLPEKLHLYHFLQSMVK